MGLDERNTELEEKIAGSSLNESVQVLIQGAKRQRRQIILLFLSICLDILLTIGLTFGFFWNHRLATKAESNHQAIIRNCETSNDARARNKQLWDYIFALPSQQPPTPEQQKVIDNFKALVNKTFALRDCSKL